MPHYWKFFTLLVISLVCSVHSEAQNGYRLEKTIRDTLFDQPESVSYHAWTKSYFVSNVGNGKVCRIDSNGAVTLFYQAPASTLGIQVTRLRVYVVVNFKDSSDKVLVLDADSAKLLWAVTIPGSKQLNDVEWAGPNEIIVSDRMDDKIYWIEIGKGYSLLSDAIKTPNGLYYDREYQDLWVCNSVQEGNLYRIAVKYGKLVEVMKTGHPNLDGLTRGSGNHLVFTSWSVDWTESKLLRWKGIDIEVLHKNSFGMADCEHHKNTGRLAVAQFYDNSVAFFVPE